MSIKGGNVRKGQFIMHNGQPHSVVEHQFVSPGKGSAFTRTKLKNLTTGKIFDYTFKTTENVELADVETTEQQYLYFDGGSYVFMDPRSYTQTEVPAELMEQEGQFLKEEMRVHVQFYNGEPIGVFLPNKVTLKVTEAQEAAMGDRQTAPKKPVQVETGATIMVPIFIKTGDQIIIDTASGEYVSRAN